MNEMQITKDVNTDKRRFIRENPQIRDNPCIEPVDIILEAKNLHKRFQHGGEQLHVIQGIDLRIPRGKIVAIVGASGAGKSTLLHILGGLQRPSEGTVLYEGDDFYSLSEEKQARFRNEKIGFVFQFYHLLPELSAVENVMLPAMIMKPRQPFSLLRKEACALLETLGLEERFNHHPNALSGGEQQRVAIARALINRPEIVLCDEPTGNLDSEIGEGILHLITSLNETMKTTFLIVTHAEEVARIASRIFSIRDGCLEEKT